MEKSLTSFFKKISATWPFGGKKQRIFITVDLVLKIFFNLAH